MNTRATVLTTTFLAGLACAGFGFYHLYRNWRMSDNAVRTTAEVIYLELPLEYIHGEIKSYHRVDEYSDECIKTVIYHTMGGDRIIWQSPITYEGANWLMGDEIYESRAASILYDPQDPDYWEYDRTLSLFVNWFVLMLAGFALMSLSFGPYDAVMRRLRDSDEERDAALTGIREELYAPTPNPGGKPARKEETPNVAESRVRSAPPGVDTDVPVLSWGEADENESDW